MENYSNNNGNMDDLIRKYMNEMVNYQSRSKHPSDYLDPIVPELEPEAIPVREPVPRMISEPEPEIMLQQASPAQPNPQLIPALQAPVVTVAPQPTAFPEMSAHNIFLQQYPAEGRIKVQVFTARRTYPVSDATVEFAKMLPDGKHVFHVAKTDLAGMTPEITVPTVSKDLSEQPGDAKPYATYDITVTASPYTEVRIHDVPVFEGIVSIQTVDMIPVSATPDGHPYIEYTVVEPTL